MKKKILSLLMVMAMAVTGLAACGGSKDSTQTGKDSNSNSNVSSDSEYSIAMITDSGDITDMSFNQSTYEAAKAFAEKNNVKFQYYKPTEDSDEARVASFNNAVADGYNVIVVPGYLFAGMIYQVATATPDVKIIALDVSAGDFEQIDKNYSIPSNVCCFTYSEELAGYMAGYAAVKEGYTIEAMMQDGKALQSGTSHFLGQNFAKAFEVQYLNKDNKPEYVWATSWGVSTRLIGALIMTHSDDNGLVLPPRLAPIQVVIIPIATKPEQMEQVNREIQPVIEALRAKGITVKFDDADNKRPGFKFADYELKGVPVRLVLGARDLENGTIEVMRRDTLEKETRPFEGIVDYVEQLLDDIQQNIFKKAKDYRDAHIFECDNYEEFKERVKDGGFFLCHWDGTAETEAQIKEETQATIRCVPFGVEQTPGVDMVSGKPSKARVIIARSY